jgi:hypothetical protein
MVDLQPLPTPEKGNIMLQPAILAIVRQVLTVVGTALVAKGYMEASDLEPIIGAVLTLGSVVWSVVDKRKR